MRKTKPGFADSLVGGAMRALSPSRVTYSDVQALIDALLDSGDPNEVTATCQRANLMLARVAASPDFDAKRHRAISQALREISRHSDAAVGALQTRAR